jgi:hypothetical protein
VGGFPANQDPKRGTPDRTGPYWDFSPGSEGTRFRGSVPGMVLPREAIPTYRGFDPFSWIPKDPSLRIERVATCPGRSPKGSSGGWGTTLGAIPPCFGILPGKVPLAGSSRSRALQGPPSEDGGLQERHQDRSSGPGTGGFQVMPPFSPDPRIRGEGFASLLFPHKASLISLPRKGSKRSFAVR